MYKFMLGILLALLTSSVAGQTPYFREVKKITTGVDISNSPFGVGILPAPDETLLLISFGQCYIQVWEVATSSKVIDNLCPDEISQYEVLKWSPDSQNVVFSGFSLRDDSFIYETYIWSRLTRTLQRVDTDSYYIYGADWHPNQPELVYVVQKYNADREQYYDEIWRYDLVNQKKTLVSDNHRLNGTIFANKIIYSPDGRLLLAQGVQQLLLWETASYTLLPWFEEIACCVDMVIEWAWSPDQRYLLMSYLGLLDFKDRRFIPFDADIRNDLDRRVIWLADSTQFITRRGHIYNVQTGILETNPPVTSSNVYFSLETDKGQYLAIWEADNNFTHSSGNAWLEIRQINTAALVQKIQYPGIYPHDVELTSQNTLFVSFSDASVHIFKYTSEEK